MQTLTVDATGGTLRPALPAAEPRRRAAVDVATAPIDFDATADDLLLPLNCPAGTVVCQLGPLSAALNPNNSNPALPFTDNVARDEARQRLHVLLPGRGSRPLDRVRRRERASPARRSSRRASNGIDYYGVETLNIALGTRQRRASTSRARAPSRTSTSAPATSASTSPRRRTSASPTTRTSCRATSTAIHGALNIDAGTGRHQLMISDEASGERRPRPHLRHGAARR